MTLRRPSGTPPPDTARIDGAATALVPLADAICARYRAEFPDEIERYGADSSLGHYTSFDFTQALHDNDVLGSLGSTAPATRSTMRWPRASSTASRPS